VGGPQRHHWLAQRQRAHGQSVGFGADSRGCGRAPLAACDGSLAHTRLRCIIGVRRANCRANRTSKSEETAILQVQCTLHCCALFTALRCTLHCPLRCAALRCTALHCTALHCTLLLTALNCTSLRCAALR
jgi:hypothetical protein